MEPGRVALINTGKYSGKLVVIVDVIDQNRVGHFFICKFCAGKLDDQYSQTELSAFISLSLSPNTPQNLLVVFLVMPICRCLL